MAGKRMRLGEILMASGVITEEQLNKALKVQSQSGGLLGEILVKLEACTNEQVALALSKQLNIPYASRENKVLAPESGQGLEKLINEQFAREHLVVPLFLDETQIAVAMADPTNFMTIENIKLITKLEVQTFIATKGQVLKTIDDFYGGKAQLERAMEETHAEKEKGDADEEAASNRVDLDTPMTMTKDTQVITMVNAIFKQALQERASDIHLERFEDRVALRYRIDGSLYERPAPPKSQFDGVISRIKILSNLDISERRLPQDGALALKAQGRFIDVRVSVCPTVFGEKVVMRILDKGSSKLDINMLGMFERQKQDFLDAAQAPFGLIYLTGPTGSGKTTTLYSILQTIKSPEINIMTIEEDRKSVV
jgi:type IV pilus assembly protein PilB